MTAALVTLDPPLSPTVHLGKRATRLPYPFDHPDCRFYARARHGLWHGVQALGLAAGDEVLVPAYHHGSEIEALVTAGLGCRFYCATETLEPDEQELDTLLTDRVRALHVTHYLGFPQDSKRWRRWCDERGLFLIEDAAQAWLSSRDGLPTGALGDCAVYCVYKTLALPDGGALISRRPPPLPDTRRRAGAVFIARSHLSWLLNQVPLLRSLRSRRKTEEGPYDPVEDFSLGDPDSEPLLATSWLMSRLDEEVASRRRDNYRCFLQGLDDVVPRAWSDLDPGASPFVFPVETANKDALLQHLRRHAIQGLNLWSVPHPSLPDGDFGIARHLRATIVGLPVHQGLNGRQIERMVTVIRDHTRSRTVMT